MSSLPLKLSCLVLLICVIGCQSGDISDVESPAILDWVLGCWEGVRREGSDGSEAPMVIRVEPALGGAGQVHHLEVQLEDTVYRGFAVQVFDSRLGRYVQQYVNSSRSRFVRLEGDLEGERITWQSVSPKRTRESRLVSERIAQDRWRKTMSISEDDGQTWRVLWMDELVAVEMSKCAL
jgi:hypothetical protein